MGLLIYYNVKQLIWGGEKGKILCEKALEMHLCHGRAGMIRNIEPDHGQLQASFTMTNPASSPFFSTAAAMVTILISGSAA